MSDKATIEVVPFAGIPNQSNLFLSYVELSAKALSFYQRPPTVAALIEFANTGLRHIVFPRKEIAAILRRQNDRFGSDARCRQHIEELEHQDCFAVVTGQQVGLFGGPLYTIYKAFTAIRIAEELRGHGIQAVPVFWLDTDDHDLAEVTRCTVVAADYSVRVTDYRELLFHDVPGSTRPVGPIEIPGTIKQAIEDYFSSLPDTKWKEPTRSRLETAYSPGTSFADAFGRLVAGLFAGHGLVLFDPRDAEAKRLVSPIFEKALKEAEEIHDALSTRARALEATGFQPQVNILESSTLLFLHSQGERKAIVREGRDFAVKGTGLHLSLEPLIRAASESPENFSPNVLLRPLVQDFLFPTLCYVGGPGEIAYFAQAETLYRKFDRPMPAVWPRTSLTLLEEEAAGIMARYRVALQDCLRGTEHVLEGILRASGKTGGSSILAALQESLTNTFDELRPVMTTAEASLGPAMDTAQRKIFHHLEGLRAKFIRSEARQNGGLLKKAELLANTCYPNQNLQERELGICHFLSRYGPKVLDAIYSLMRFDGFAHRAVALSPDH